MDLPVVNHEDYFAKIGDDHKFPINKFGELANYLIQNRIVNKFHKPYACSSETLSYAHSEKYISNIKNKTLSEEGIKKIGFPLIDSVVQRSLVATGGTVLASKLAINYGISCNTAGGSHHANYDSGAGYCVFNDVAVAAHYLLNRGLANKILIVDLDVHQGDGTASIFAFDDKVFTFSIHCAKNFPFRKQQSDWDIALSMNITDQEYLDVVRQSVDSLIRRKPELIIYQAGVDPLIHDRLGKLSLSRETLRRRNHIVLRAAKENNIPINMAVIETAIVSFWIKTR